MAIRKIVEKGDKVLEKHCRPITEFNDRLHILLDDLKETLAVSNGVGLASPQVGILRRAVVVLETNVGEDEEEYYIELVNPEIIASDGEQTGSEGCLSLPGKYGVVTRPNYVKVRAQDRNGNTFEVEGEGLTARCFCHELDHLDGILFTERATRMLPQEDDAE
ncbi:MAG: peptide deformylase [Oscillospiraceae bacterium]